MRWLKGLNIPVINRGIEIMEKINECIKEIDKEIERIAVRYEEEIRILMSIPGIGRYSACMIISEIGEVDRFEDGEKLTSYAGLAAGIEKSGNITRYRGITREGNRYLRWILIEVVHIHIRIADSGITRLYKRVKEKKGKKKAIVAGTRKLCKAIYYMLKRKEEFKG